MSIRLKLIVTYVFSVIVGALIVAAFIVMTTGNYMNTARRAIIGTTNMNEAVVEMVDMLAELKQTSKYDEQMLTDENYMNEINDRLQLFNSGLVVLYDDKYYNIMDIDNSVIDDQILLVTNVDEEVAENYREYYNWHARNRDELEEEDSPFESFEVGDSSYSYLDYPFFVEDELIVYFFITDVTKLTQMNGDLVGLAIIVSIIFIFALMFPLMIMIQKDIVKPLNELDRGAKQISKGNLDFKLKTKKKNEVGHVVGSYEKMRIELKKSIEKQVQYENNRKELISSISHDLKTPMTSIKGYVEGILDGVANTDEKMERYLKVIHQKSLDMDMLIDDLFTFSKLDLQKLPFEFSVVNMEMYMRDYYESAVMEFTSEGNLDFSYKNNHPTKPLVDLDPQQFRRVLQNLISNSYKYSESEIKGVEILMTNDEDTLSIAIKDHGIGMDEEELSHAFDMFYRSDDSRNTKTGGSGLGLAIVKQIVLEHKGTINARSAKGKGTTITITLNKTKVNEND